MRSFAVLLLIASCVGLANAKPDPWVEIRTPHFVIVADSSERQACKVAEQFERMRAALPDSTQGQIISIEVRK